MPAAPRSLSLGQTSLLTPGPVSQFSTHISWRAQTQHISPKLTIYLLAGLPTRLPHPAHLHQTSQPLVSKPEPQPFLRQSITRSYSFHLENLSRPFSLPSVSTAIVRAHQALTQTTTLPPFRTLPHSTRILWFNLHMAEGG